MSPYFNTSNMTNASRYEGLAAYGDEVTGGYFAPMLVMTVWLILVMALGYYAKEEGMAAATALTWVFALLLWAGGIGSWMNVAVCFAATIVTALVLYMKR